jgi:hypothetical protein
MICKFSNRYLTFIIRLYTALPTLSAFLISFIITVFSVRHLTIAKSKENQSIFQIFIEYASASLFFYIYQIQRYIWFAEIHKNKTIQRCQFTCTYDPEVPLTPIC